MPKRKEPSNPEEQAVRFQEEAQTLIDGGELSPTDAKEALESIVKTQGQPAR